MLFMVEKVYLVLLKLNQNKMLLMFLLVIKLRMKSLMISAGNFSKPFFKNNALNPFLISLNEKISSIFLALTPLPKFVIISICKV